MADITRLTGGERGVEVGQNRPSPRLQSKLLEIVPGRAGRRALEEVRTLRRGIPTEFEVPGGEKVTLLMTGKPDMRADPRDVDLVGELMLLDIGLARMVPPERPFNEMIMPERLSYTITPLDRFDLIYIDTRHDE
ncbi:MAG: hypothetical protein WC350_03695 [Candidatus Micrarchaeia archaeon]|jgi:hypothetical protein